jgi:hypothetical protein
MEAMWRGQKGDKGDRGEKGQRGLPRNQARAVVYLFLLNLALFVTLAAGLFHYVHSTRAGLAAQAHAQQVAQRKAGQLIEKSLCADLGTMAAIRPPAGNPAANPSRAYEQDEARAWAGLVRDLGCKETPR